MSEQRKNPRTPCFLRGEIRLYNGEKRIACEIHDLSDNGFRLTGFATPEVPESFVLAIPRRSFLERVKVVRRADDSLGVRLDAR